MKVLSIDLETFSPINIKCGAYKYAEKSEIILFAYSVDYGPVTCLDLTKEGLPGWIAAALTSPHYKKKAFNASFERSQLNAFYGIYSPPEQWECTLVRAAMCGLPLSLDDASKALGLIEKKDSAGKALINYFSIPCKPTKANGERTRNLPEHHPEKWQQFIEYCKQDVVTEQAVEKACSWYKIPEIEHKLWCLNERKNERGVKVDLDLIRSAMQIDQVYRAELIEEATEISGLANVNSPKQLKEWLTAEMEETIDSLAKQKVNALLLDIEEGDAKRILQIRQLMSRSSITKYRSMLLAASAADSRVRGMIQYYGANRTGREAGRICQPQNYPRIEEDFGKMIDDVRELVKRGDVEMLHMVFKNLSDVLVQLLRTTFIADEGSELIVLDFSAIEAVVLACIADEDWRIKFFRSGGDIYKASGSIMFKTPIEKITKEQRQKSKVAELLCIEENQLVLTNNGLIPIKDVSLCDKVWDGFDWVTHEGIIFKGFKEVINYDGLTATKNHIVWIEGKQNPVSIEYAAACGASLLRSGDGRKNIRVGKNYQSRKTVEEKLASSYGFNRMHQLRLSSMDKFILSNAQHNERLSKMLQTSKSTNVAYSTAKRSNAALPKHKRQRLQKLWSTRNNFQLSFGIGSRSVDNKQFGTSRKVFRIGSNKKRFTLRTRKHKICNKRIKPSQPPYFSNSFFQTRRMALRQISSNSQTISRVNSGRNFCRRRISCQKQMAQLQGNRKKVAVYDIVNSGPFNRFTVSNVLVHNCGYGGSTGAMERNNDTIEDPKKRIPVKEIPGIVKTWREANPNIVQLWWDTDKAAKNAIRTGENTPVKHGIMFGMKNGNLLMKLPSGRCLVYHKAHLRKFYIAHIPERDTKGNLFMRKDDDGKEFNKIINVKIGEVRNQSIKEYTYYLNRAGLQDDSTKPTIRETICFWGMGKIWGIIETYGPKLVENFVQAISRDLLMHSIINVEDAGYPVILSVHDELATENKKGSVTLEEIKEIMLDLPTWAKGWPVRADGFTGDYYQK